MGLARRRSRAAAVRGRPRSVYGRAAPGRRHRRGDGHRGALGRCGHRRLRGLASARRAVPDDSNRRRVLGHAGSPRLDRSPGGNSRGRGRRGRHDRPDRRSRRPRAVRSPRNPPDRRAQRLRGSSRATSGTARLRTAGRRAAAIRAARAASVRACAGARWSCHGQPAGARARSNASSDGAARAHCSGRFSSRQVAQRRQAVRGSRAEREARHAPSLAYAERGESGSPVIVDLDEVPGSADCKGSSRTSSHSSAAWPEGATDPAAFACPQTPWAQAGAARDHGSRRTCASRHRRNA